MPNGTGVLGATALPQKEFVAELSRTTAGVFWLESPPSTGKTALGQLLVNLDTTWQYLNIQACGSAINDEDLAKISVKCFIDEAQLLTLQNTQILRGLAAQGSRIICAGISGAPVPACTHNHAGNCRLCVNCWKYPCDGSHDIVACPDPNFQETISMVIADTPGTRFSVDNLAVKPRELETFLTLFFSGERTLCCHISETLAPAVAQLLAPALIELTGGIMSFIIAILRTIYYEQKMGQTKPTILEADKMAGSFMALVNRQEVQSALQNTRLVVNLTEGERRALVAFVRDRTTPEESQGSALCRKALLRKQQDGSYVVWSPLLYDVLTHKLLFDTGHAASSFNSKCLRSLIKFVVSELKSKTYCDWVFDKSTQRMKHEDEMNSAIASILKLALGHTGYHRGPAKQTANGVYSQVDHAIYWADGRRPTLIESCLADVKGHVERFRADLGTYTAAYNFATGVVLVVNGTKEPQKPKCAVPANTHLFHVSVPTFTIKEFTDRSWVSLS